MKKFNILIAMLGVVGFITQAQAKIVDGLSQQETNPNFLFEKEKGEIYFGEWAQKTPDTSDIIHTVFNTDKEVKEVIAEIPNNGTTIYTAKGITDLSGRNYLYGKLTANFDSKKLVGSISNSLLTIGIDANIETNGYFSGKATASGTIGKDYYEKINGISFGKFIEIPYIQPSLSGWAIFNKEGKAAMFGADKQ
ncbi:hypothetical protein [Xenorhabdus taiwanensis]|uniref:HphA C-terminal domain-containing protein n=1 Tax=Xenorhabdus taiwanensis TaxID=3085177 RepID=A0ABN7C8H2_9GAMM|nr:hypothetical protein TCT1_35880 [Xenorhabdus sp. TCT-1]